MRKHRENFGCTSHQSDLRDAKAVILLVRIIRDHLKAPAYISALEHPGAFSFFVYFVPVSQSDQRPSCDVLSNGACLSDQAVRRS
jgi:hypothetical protein